MKGDQLGFGLGNQKGEMMASLKERNWVPRKGNEKDCKREIESGWQRGVGMDD